MRTPLKFTIAALFALVLSGCGHFANLGIDSARLDTANKQLLAYSSEIQVLAELGESLVVRGVITKSQGRNAGVYLQRALDLVEEAQEAIVATGDPLTAETKIIRVQRSISLALELLTSLAPNPSIIFEHNTNERPILWQSIPV